MIYFRADGNARIGMGHLMRTLSIAKEVQKEEECVFLCSDEASGLVVKENGLKVILTKTQAFSMEEAEWIAEKYDDQGTILVDSYLATNEYFKILRKNKKVFYLDDLGEEKFDVDVIINYNSYADEKSYISLYEGVKNPPEFIIGSRFVPLRDEFVNARASANNEVKNILLTTGGGDIDNISGSILDKLLSSLDENDIKINVVIGAMNPNYEKLIKMAKADSRVLIHRDVRKMSELMKNMDAAISAGGSTCYELCAMNIPFVVFSYADNQIKLSSDMDKKKAACLAGHIFNENSKKTVINNICEKMKLIIQDESVRNLMREHSLNVTDGLGAKRLAKMLVGKMEG
ncbi:MAG: UDP-2,4-diacetamido-2,4,6-trideoxy-beta-L-altropyranose hydrolase [Lachnospiraceae bacterium]|nr:UDP-2,4-diacetamido-2,4,6-trideoxy-beta-L-altropyranose hydrolase [Lachnospiraceae bacterium]